ncbi:hypothetical protein EMIT079MI2_110047 [Bacillus sp. IT-79MI2]|uniref:Uncharacterized protein n=1 Tax=Bacillus pseudomycoides TaxID=64104 RepID=A0A1Y3MKX0_9BACI|nr:hypothetical protein BW425_16780 [Bacillus pseudomycoides]
MIVKRKDAEKFSSKINHANNKKERKLITAKITGNFKRGNERKENINKNQIHLYVIISPFKNSYQN